METFIIQKGEYIELQDLLKATGLCQSGGTAKNAIVNGLVSVDGMMEKMRRSKVYKGQTVEYLGRKIRLQENSQPLDEGQ